MFTVRLRFYHVFAWIVSAAFAAGMTSSNVYGFWFLDQTVDSTAICWVHLKRSNSFTVYPLIMFYIPLAMVYLFAIVVYFIAYQRLRYGISQTIVHRLKALISNSINLTILIVYWLIAGIFYIIAFVLPSTEALQSNYLLKAFLFLIASKGVFSLIVWIFTIDIQLGEEVDDKADEEDDEQRVDLNSALRQEVLHFATKGIRHCTMHSSCFTEDQVEQVVLLEHVEDSHRGSTNLSLQFFFFLMFGREQERKFVAKLVEKSKKRQRKSIMIREVQTSETFR